MRQMGANGGIGVARRTKLHTWPEEAPEPPNKRRWRKRPPRAASRRTSCTPGAPEPVARRFGGEGKGQAVFGGGEAQNRSVQNSPGTRRMERPAPTARPLSAADRTISAVAKRSIVCVPAQASWQYLHVWMVPQQAATRRQPLA